MFFHSVTVLRTPWGLAATMLVIGLSCHTGSKTGSAGEQPEGTERIVCGGVDRCPDGYRCVDEVCRLACSPEHTCPTALPVCVEGLCVVSQNSDSEGTGVEPDDDPPDDLDPAETQSDPGDDTDRNDVDSGEDDTSETTDAEWSADNVFDTPEAAGDTATEEGDGTPDQSQDSLDEESESHEWPAEDSSDCFEIQGPCWSPWSCRPLPGGSLCNNSADRQWRCVPPVGGPGDAPSTCGWTVQAADVYRVCSGDSPDCDGPLVPQTNWSDDRECSPARLRCVVGDATTGPVSGNCIYDPDLCCNCSTGPCCQERCRIAPTHTPCDLLGSTLRCNNQISPARVERQDHVITCGGQRADVCDGPTSDVDWTFSSICGASEVCKVSAAGKPYCSPTSCSNNQTCLGSQLNLYCRNGECLLRDNPCTVDPSGNKICADSAQFCQTAYFQCSRLDVPCASDADCQGHPDGPTCDAIIHKCAKPDTCNVARNNCRPPTQCVHLDELLGLHGDFCVNCQSDNDCRSGEHCEKRLPPVSANVCRAP